MNKIDFPTGIELPLRGGGTAFLYEFFEDRWWGRATLPGDCWCVRTWRMGGEYLNAPCPNDIVWTPPKRTVWLVWGDGHAVPATYRDKADALELVHEHGGIIQEIEEP